MKRIDKAYELHPDGVDLDGVTIPKEEYIHEFCPFNLGVENEENGNYTGEHGYGKDLNVKGCRGIICEECWNKEIEK